MRERGGDLVVVGPGVRGEVAEGGASEVEEDVSFRS